MDSIEVSMRLALVLLLLLLPANATLDLTTSVHGTGLVILQGPGNESFMGHLEGQNMSLEWNLTEEDFERRI